MDGPIWENILRSQIGFSKFLKTTKNKYDNRVLQ